MKTFFKISEWFITVMLMIGTTVQIGAAIFAVAVFLTYFHEQAFGMEFGTRVCIINACIILIALLLTIRDKLAEMYSACLPPKDKS